MQLLSMQTIENDHCVMEMCSDLDNAARDNCSHFHFDWNSIRIDNLHLIILIIHTSQH